MALTRPRYSQIPDSDYKNSCRIVTTTDITLTSGAPLTYDGVTLIQYDRVLVTGQTDKTQNGIYSVSTLGSGSNGSWVRSKDANANDRLTAGMNTFIEEGTYSGQFWHLLTPGPIVLGVTELIFGQISGNAAGTSSQVQYNEAGSIAGAANLRYDSTTGNVLIGGGTVSTSNVTGALTVNGGIGVTGEIWAQGNIYSVGSRVLTAYDLQTVTFTANYISKDPANVSVPVVGTGTIYGTHNFGNLEAISTYGDYNTTAQSGYYSVNDASGAPGFIVYVGFTGITSFNRAVFNINYTQQSGHTVTLDFYNYDTDAWDPFATYSGLGNWQSFTLGVIDANPYIDAAGNVTSRVYHVSSGNTAHRTWIDYVALEQSITGGQGPRGPTGATGPSGTYSGGYISGNIVTGGNIITSGNFVSNSGNVSTSITSGALVLTGEGGAGIGGNVNVGGNVTADKFYTTNGLFWSANGLAFSSGLEVSEINTANTLSNISSQVTAIRFDKDTGFSVTELNPGNIKVSLGSSFKTWHVPGQSDLVAMAEDEVTFFGNGIDITTHPTYPKSITFISNNMLLEANIGAFYNYANANIGSIYNNVNTLDANIGSYQIYANANVGSIYNNLTTLDANIGSYQLYSNANVGSIYNNLNTLDANIGSFQTYSNLTIADIVNNANTNIAAYLTTTTSSNIVAANINTGNIFSNSVTITGNIIGGNIISSNVYTGNIVSSGNITTSGNVIIDGNLIVQGVDILSNIGVFQSYANIEFGTISDAIDDLYTNTTDFYSYANLSLGDILANLGAFETYANSKIGTNNNSNLVIQSTTDSVSALTGALVVAGGAGIGGNLYVAGNIFASNLVSINSTTLSVTDPLLYLTASDPFPYNYDIGFYSHFVGGPGSNHYQHTGMARNYATGYWTFFSNVSSEAGTTINWAEANLIYDTVRLGDIIVSNTTQSTSTTTGALRVAGGAGIAGELYIANTGDVSANIGTLFLGNASTQANLGAYQSYANNAISNVSLDLSLYKLYANANIGAYQSYANANIGAYQLYANANIGSIYNNLNTLDANIGSYQLYANANIGLLYLSNISTNANLGAFQSYSNANVGSIYNNLTTLDANIGSYQTFANANLATQTTNYNTLNANLGAYQLYSNANVGSIYNNLTTLDANIGSYQTFANANVGSIYNNLTTLDANIGSYQTFANANAATQATSINTINANIGSFYTYANTLIGPGNTGNLVVNATTDSTSQVTGALVVKGGAGIAGNIYSGGNIVVTSNVSANKFYTTDGIYWTGNGAAYAAGGGGGSSFTYTASATTPVGPVVGDQWFDTVDGILYEYIDDGDSNQWVDIQSATLSSNNVVTSITGNISTNGNISSAGSVISANIFTGNISSNANISSGNVTTGNITATGNITTSGTVYATTVTAAGNISGANVTTGNISTTGNITSTQNMAASTIITSGGVYWANGTAFASTTYSNSNVASYLVTGANIGSGSTTANLVALATTAATSTTTGALVVAGGMGVAGNIFAAGNIVLGTGTTSNVVAAATTTSTSATTGALVVVGGLGVSGNIFAVGNIVLGTGTTSNLVANATTTSTSATTGALVVRGGMGVAGNIFATGNVILGTGTTSNLVAAATTTSTSTTTGALVVKGGAGIAGNVYTDKLYTTNGLYWAGNGAVFSPAPTSIFSTNVVLTSGTASTNTTTGALVITGSGGMGVGGTAYFGSTSYFAGTLTVSSTAITGSPSTGALVVAGGLGVGGDIISGGFIQSTNGVVSTSVSTGAVTVQSGGGMGITGNLYVGNELVVPGGGKLTSTGLAYLLEKVTVSASAPSSTANVDISTQSVLYWTGNATANVTANIRSTATQPLNSLLAVGQSITAVIFLPNGPSNYLVNTVKIDNTTVTPAYQGNAAPVLGNSNSIDIYSFTILKTADATYKVFASQTQFMHPG